MVSTFPAGRVVYAKVQMLYLLLAFMHDHTMLYDRSYAPTTASSDCPHEISLSYLATVRVTGCAAVSTCSYLVPAGKCRRTGLRTPYIRHRTYHTQLASTSSLTYWSPSTVVRTTLSTFHRFIGTHVISRANTPPYDVKRI